MAEVNYQTAMASGILHAVQSIEASGTHLNRVVVKCGRLLFGPWIYTTQEATCPKCRAVIDPPAPRDPNAKTAWERMLDDF